MSRSGRKRIKYAKESMAVAVIITRDQFRIIEIITCIHFDTIR